MKVTFHGKRVCALKIHSKGGFAKLFLHQKFPDLWYMYIAEEIESKSYLYLISFVACALRTYTDASD